MQQALQTGVTFPFKLGYAVGAAPVRLLGQAVGAATGAHAKAKANANAAVKANQYAKSEAGIYQAVKEARDAAATRKAQERAAYQLGREAIRFQNTQKRAANMNRLAARQAKLKAIYGMTSNNINAIYTSAKIGPLNNSNAKKRKLKSYVSSKPKNYPYANEFANMYAVALLNRGSRAKSSSRFRNVIGKARTNWAGSYKTAAVKSRLGGFFSGLRSRLMRRGTVLNKANITLLTKQIPVKNTQGQNTGRTVIVKRNARTRQWNFANNANRTTVSLSGVNTNNPVATKK